MAPGQAAVIGRLGGSVRCVSSLPAMNRQPIHLVLTVLLVFSWRLGLCQAQGFDTQSVVGSRLPKAVFARYVPAVVPLYLEVRHLGKLDEAMRRAHAWTLVPLAAGRQVPATEPFALPTAVAALFGVPTSAALEKVMDCRAGAAAMSW